MTKKGIRRLFIGVMIFLPLQYAVVGIVGFYDAEPWPAFVFPGFKSVPVMNGAFETEQKVFELVSDDDLSDKLQVTPAELFTDIPVSQLSGFLRENFPSDRDYTSLSPEARQWMLNRADEIVSFNVEKISLVTVLEYRRFENGSMSLDSTAIVQKQTIVSGGM
jgi:hypothetical protein